MSDKKPTPQTHDIAEKTAKKPSLTAPDDEKGGFKDAGLPEPTAHGDWNVRGRCSDF